VVAVPFQHWNLAVAARLGGTMHMRQGDSTIIGTARIPNHFSASLGYDGFAGSAIAVRYGRDNWTAMRGLGSTDVHINDATEFSAGAEIAGPKIGRLPMGIRFGTRMRELPFALDERVVKEQALTAGVGLPLAAGRTSFDLAVERAHRTVSGVSETGWVVSLGFGIKP
jgi:hypothetical protein